MTEKEFKKKYGRLGDCSKVTFDIITLYSEHRELFHPELHIFLGNFGEVKLANGVVWHDETKWHVHAWIEDDVFCYDFSNGNKAIIQKERYYRIGKVKDVRLYTAEEAIKKGLDTGVAGFWDMPKKMS
jgi:hypothetical protein